MVGTSSMALQEGYFCVVAKFVLLADISSNDICNFGTRRLFCFGSLEVLDVVCGYLLFFLLDIKIENR